MSIGKFDVWCKDSSKNNQFELVHANLISVRVDNVLSDLASKGVSACHVFCKGDSCFKLHYLPDLNVWTNDYLLGFISCINSLAVAEVR